MAHLQEVLLRAERRPAVLHDCVALIDEEVQKKSGLTGIAVKGAYAVVKKIKPGIVAELCEKLVDEFASKLDPIYQRYVQAQAPGGLSAYFAGRPTEVAEALLAITDERAKASDNRTLRSVYDKLRPSGVKHVEAAVPGIGKLVEKHTA